MDLNAYGGSIASSTYTSTNDRDSDLADANLFNGLRVDSAPADKTTVGDPLLIPHDARYANFVSNVSHEAVPQADLDFSDIVLRYISQILMEEDSEEEVCRLQESHLALQAAEKSFYEVIGADYPSSQIGSCFEQASGPSNDGHNGPHIKCSQSGCNPPSNLTNPSQNSNFLVTPSCPNPNVVVDLNLHSGPKSLTNSDHVFDTSENSTRYLNIFSEGEFDLQFRKVVEEASSCLPNDCRAFIKGNGLLHKDLNAENKSVDEECGIESMDGLRGRKNTHFGNAELECGRSAKQSAVHSDSALIIEMFDDMLLSSREDHVSALREAFLNKAGKHVLQNGQSRKSNSDKARRMKPRGKRDVVDLETLLILCAQAIATGNRSGAYDFLKDIRNHSSPTGDGMQRLACYFADGLEARLSGSGTQRYSELLVRPRTAAQVLKSHYVFLAVCPIVKLAYFFSNKTILHAAERATRLHIIDFGMTYGFQWPSFIEQLSSRPGGPPKLRITAIDFPRSGFKPAEKVEEGVKRLAKYAERFNIPFEYKAIAQKWETVRKEDIITGRESDEVVAVNCIYRFRYVLDESVGLESPRHTVLKLIKSLNPDVFVQAVANVAQSAPFFLTRVHEAIYSYTALFDICETILPRENPERMAVEKELFGREIMNILACEGPERVERPETYKRWKVRLERAGFKQLPLDKNLFRIAKDRVASVYHKDFVVDEDGQWLLMGWKGRIITAVTAWKPVQESSSSII